MNTHKWIQMIKQKSGFIVGIPIVALIVLITLWNIFFHYVSPGEILVVISKTGDELPAGRLIANPGEKGPLKEVLGEGRHFVMPVVYDVEKHSLNRLNMDIPPLKIGVVRAKVGTPLPKSRILAKKGERGIQRNVLPPGRHRLNPYAHEVEIRDATVIMPGHVGFVTRLVGVEPKGRFASDPNEKGIRKDVLQPGIYYLNTYEYRVREVEIGLNQVSLLGKDQITFPSKDAFEIALDATVEWELKPDKVAEVIDEFGARKEIEEKVLIAQSVSIGRLEGSGYGAKDFLLGEGREKIQDSLRNKLMQKCREKHVEVLSAYIRHITIPENLLIPIRASFIAKEIELTAQEKERTRKSTAELQRQQQLIVQRRAEVLAETQALVQQINAEAAKLVGGIAADTRRLVAEKQQEIALLESQSTLILGEAKAKVQQMLGEAKANLFKLNVDAFGGDSTAYAGYVFSSGLSSTLKIQLVQSGEGTFWTDLNHAGGLNQITGKLLQSTIQSR
jgi:hypothetical protein